MKSHLAFISRMHCVAVFGAVFVLIQPGLSALALTTDAEAALRWTDARDLRIEGKGWTDTKDFYDRLPARAEKQVRQPVWSLSRDSSGMCVRFVTDATTIAARWTLRKENLAMAHMPASGVSGLDLYVKESGGWRWLGGGRPAKKVEERILVRGLEPVRREYVLYLPLYNGVEEVSIGIPAAAELEAARERSRAKPVVFYGTSIVQGGCASRPGMAYPAILGRRFDATTINLGFSGNAQCEPEVAKLLSELDPAVYVLDPLPNMTGKMVAERFEEFVRVLREAHPNTPIVMIEHLPYVDGKYVETRRERHLGATENLRVIYEKLVRAGQKRLFYVSADKLIGDDGEGTVDGTHPTDLGFQRMADGIEPLLRRALKAAR